MTLEEFSDEFDVLLQVYNINPQYGMTDPLSFSEYEKSVFLTQSQEEIVKELYNGKNQFNDSFEKTEEIKSYLNNLNKTYVTDIKLDKSDYKGLDSNSIFFQLPEDLWFITYESVSFEGLKCFDNKHILVTPVTQNDFYKTNENPFRGAGKRRVLRIDYGNGIAELISKYNIKEYLVKYVSKPQPIILIDLPSELSINGINRKTECKLNSAIHRNLLERAVKLAVSTKIMSNRQNN